MAQTIYTPSITSIKEDDPKTKASFTIEPLLAGYGMTLGNSLRRVLLSSISGAAIVSFKAEGASHEFMTLQGVKEDLMQIMLNLKKIRFKIVEPENEEDLDKSQAVHLELTKTGAGPVLAKDIKPHPYLEIINGDHLIATLDSAKDKINLDIVVSFGLGYLSIEDSENTYAKNDYISLDALFSPVLRVRYKIENTRVGRMTNLDRLILTVETDGSLSPKDAFEEAAAILKEHYNVLSGATNIVSQSFISPTGEINDPEANMQTDERLEFHLEDLQLSARTTNALINNNLYTVQDVINLSDAEFKELRGFGAIALQEIKDKMKELGF